jgi:16S rRNA (guanine966-N2)-methyltransferase
VTRIIAGAARGRRLRVPAGGTRPTSDRAREALFSALESARGGLGGAVVLDLYAGSGAVGLEALSRGAAHATLVERDPRAASVLRANAATVGLPGAEVVADSVERRVGQDATRAYDVVFADPPYAEPAERVAAVLAALRDHGWLAPGAWVVVERSARHPFGWPPGYTPERDRRYGEAALWYGRAAGAGEVS